MANPIQIAQELEGLIERVLYELKMADGPREKMELALIKTTHVLSLLQEVHTNAIPLELGEALRKNLQYWNDAQTGPIRHGDKAFKLIIENSETLDCIQRAGVDIKELTKFSPSELNIAMELAGRYREWYRGLEGIKQSISNGRDDCYVRSNRGAFDAMRDFLMLLKRQEIIGDFKCSVYNQKNTTYEERQIEEIKAIKDYKHWVGFSFNLMRRQHNTFLTGDWFTAYAYQLISWYLTKNKADYELYTKVRYKCLPEFMRSEGDFDVIGKIKDKLLLVECKSGNLGNDMRKLVEKTQVLKKVFKSAKVGVKEYIFWLVYNPEIRENDEIISSVEQSGIRPVKPEEIRDTLYTLYD